MIGFSFRKLPGLTLLLLVLPAYSLAADIVYTCAAEGIGDQDDMCIWLHPKDPSKSLIITADKDADFLFVYNLSGVEVSAHKLPYRPGNIDIIYNFPLNGESIDLVGFNTRSKNKGRFGFYKVNHETLDLDSIGFPLTENWSDELYGFALYKSPNDGTFSAFGSDQSSRIQQYQFFDDGTGNIALEHKRTWQNGTTANPTEGMVADHEAGLLYAANENQGIFVYQADGDASTDHIRFLGLDPGNLDDDVEGVTLYYAADGEGYLIASSQGENYFSVFKRSGNNDFVGIFKIGGVVDTDGIDVLSLPLNPDFPAGIFVCHNDRVEPQPVELVSWADIANDLDPMLALDTTYWDPRSLSTSTRDISAWETNFSIAPNPTFGETSLKFSLKKQDLVQCQIIDLSGKHVLEVTNTSLPAGAHQYIFSASELDAGVYFCRLQMGELSMVQKMMVL